MHSLETGKYYWYKHKTENVWRPAKVIEESGIQLLYSIDVVPMEISSIRLSNFEFRELPPPESKQENEIKGAIRQSLGLIYNKPVAEITMREIDEEYLRVQDEGYEGWLNWHVEYSMANMTMPEGKKEELEALENDK